MQQIAPWDLFWNSLDSEKKQLFRLLQRAYYELGKDKQMFSYSHLGIKREIFDYVLSKYAVDLENLPKAAK